MSVIVPTCTHVDLLSEALDSIYRQEGSGSLFDLEVIVVDDASAHDTQRIVAGYPARYLRHQVNRGLPATLNTGIEASGGRYVAFLADDDLWLPGKLRSQVPVLEAKPDVGLVYSSQITRLGQDETHPGDWVGPSGRVFENLLDSCFIGYLTVLVRRTALAQVGAVDADMAGVEDYDLWLRLARDFSFQYVPGPVGVYRQSRQGMFITHIASGEAKRLHRRVIDKALASAPYISGAAAQRIRDRVELTNFEHLCLLPADKAIPAMLQHLRECPRLVQDRHVRVNLGRNVCLEATASPSPLQFVSTVCVALELAGGNGRQTRRLVAAVWTAVAFGLLLTGRPVAAARAAWRAIRRDPIEMAGKSLEEAGRLIRGALRRTARGLSERGIRKPSRQPT